MEDYWYEEELPRIIPALGENALKAIVGWLVSYARLSGLASDDYDISAIVRPSIVSQDNSSDRIEGALIDAVRDLAIPAMRTNPSETANILVRSGVQLLQKIAIYVVAEALRRELEDNGDVEALAGIAKQLLGDAKSDDEYIRVEYARLAQEAARADNTATSVIVDFLARAFETDLTWMRERVPRDEGITEEGWESKIRAKARRYRHSWLAAIGMDSLPEVLREELLKLNEENGVIDKPLEPLGQITSWTGPNPHTSQEEMLSMAPLELVAHLANWHDNGDGWGPEPSHEGQGRALSGLLTTNPLALEGVPQLGKRLRPTYLRAILKGWESALKADLPLNWQQAFELVEHVLNHPLASPFPIEGGDFDDDKNYSGAKGAAIGLIEELLKKQGSVVVPEYYEEHFARMLINYSNDEDAWVAYDTYERGVSEWDPLNMSLNFQWPGIVRALIIAATRTKEAAWRGEALKVIEREMSRVDQHGAGRAALGEGLGRLMQAAPDWVDEHLEEFVGTREAISIAQQIVLTTAMAIYRYNPVMYELLTPSMLAAIDVGDSLTAGWKSDLEPLPRIGEWVIDAYVFGDISADDPVFQSFFGLVTPSVRGEALAHIAWSFFRADKVDDSIRDRFGRLWDDRIRHVREHPEETQELRGIYWLARSSTFSSEWWLPRLRDILELDPAIGSERTTIGKELAQASFSDPVAALKVLKLVIGDSPEGGRFTYDLSRRAIPVVIANAMRFGDTQLGADAENYMNQLGARGNHGLEEEVQEVLKGSLGIDDMED
ncbi:hypothetical protein [Flaviflexus massiliensis]|uniref:hypothetical protein n=1 Tax=Flaviflexus massiliensis TaxID=1522309 RepID=UPI0011C8AD22|nr:hypothetical protein [Flaviflexus massiliensis]